MCPEDRCSSIASPAAKNVPVGEADNRPSPLDGTAAEVANATLPSQSIVNLFCFRLPSAMDRIDFANHIPLYFDEEEEDKENDEPEPQKHALSSNPKEEEKRPTKRKKRNTFTCANCSFVNDGADSNCSACGKARGWDKGFGSLGTQRWKCLHCLTHNSNDKLHCACCKAGSDGSSPPPETSMDAAAPLNGFIGAGGFTVGSSTSPPPTTTTTATRFTFEGASSIESGGFALFGTNQSQKEPTGFVFGAAAYSISTHPEDADAAATGGGGGAFSFGSGAGAPTFSATTTSPTDQRLRALYRAK